MQTMYLISDSASANLSRQGALRLNSRPLPAAFFAIRTGIRSGIACHGTIQRMRHPAAVLDSGGSNGSGSNGAGQHHSIQHPLFPDVQQAAVGPLPVRTQRGLPLFSPMIGNPPCPSCAGTGKTTCGDCRQAAEAEVAGISGPDAQGFCHNFRALPNRRCALDPPALLEWCHTLGPCRGKGRLNYRGVAMLPQGVWPQW